MNLALTILTAVGFSTTAFADSTPHVKFLYESMQLKAEYDSYQAIRVTFAQAQEKCKEIGARLPTNREWASEISLLTGEQTIFETEFPQAELPFVITDPKEIQDLSLRNEALQMQINHANLVPKLDNNGHWVVDFYYRPGYLCDYWLAKAIRSALSSNNINFDKFYTSGRSPNFAPFVIETSPVSSRITPQYFPEDDQFVCVRD